MSHCPPAPPRALCVFDTTCDCAPGASAAAPVIPPPAGPAVPGEEDERWRGGERRTVWEGCSGSGAIWV